MKIFSCALMMAASGGRLPGAELAPAELAPAELAPAELAPAELAGTGMAGSRGPSGWGSAGGIPVRLAVCALAGWRDARVVLEAVLSDDALAGFGAMGIALPTR
jgi:hypothetical protein